ncbi:MAG: hypothetical protein AB7O67_15770 [Vicinamibacterales bacterium]
MEFNKLVIGALAAGSLTAAAGGAYMAVRHNAEDAAQAREALVAAAPATAVADGVPVEASEGLIPAPTEPAAPAVEPAAPVDPPPAPRVEPPKPAPAPRPARRAQAPAPEPLPPPEPPPALAADTDGTSMWEARRPVDPTVPERAPEPPPAPEFLDLVVPAESVLGLQIDRTLSSETARVEDEVEARVTRDIRVGDRVAIPSGAVVHGSVIDVQQGGKIKDVARLAVRFHTIVLADGTRLPIRTDAVIREGQSPGKESAAKIGGAAVGGAILGAILGGGRGATIGGAVGAAGGTAATMAGGRNPAVLPGGTTVSVRIQSPVTVTVDKE